MGWSRTGPVGAERGLGPRLGVGRRVEFGVGWWKAGGESSVRLGGTGGAGSGRSGQNSGLSTRAVEGA